MYGVHTLVKIMKYERVVRYVGSILADEEKEDRV